MSRPANARRNQFQIRPGILGISVFALGTLFIAPAVGSGPSQSRTVYMISDDINDISVPVDLGDWNPPVPAGDSVDRPAPQPAPAPAPSNNGNGNGGSHDNNGHGNNLDGVDVSNPGQGHGGPNGEVDPSGGVDDEIR